MRTYKSYTPNRKFRRQYPNGPREIVRAMTLLGILIAALLIIAAYFLGG